MKQSRKKSFKKGFISIVSAIIIAGIIAVSSVSIALIFQDPNPSDTVIRAKLKEASLRYNIPSVIFMGIAYTESKWKHFDEKGAVKIHYNTNGTFDIGIMQINSSNRQDIERLKSDVFYNIEVGAQILDNKWKITPGIGDRDRNILENWYYAIWAYNGFSYINHPQNPSGRRYQEKVLDYIQTFILGTDSQPLWTPVKISRPNPLDILNPPQWIPTPTPYNYGDLFAGIYDGDNVKILEASADSIIQANSEFEISYILQNVGTTTWRKGDFNNPNYFAILEIKKDSNLLTSRFDLDSIVLPGETKTLTFKGILKDEGEFTLSLQMYNKEKPFGPLIQSRVVALNLQINNTPLNLNGKPLKPLDALDFKYTVKTSSKEKIFLKPFALLELFDEKDTLVDSSLITLTPFTLNDGNQNELKFSYTIKAKEISALKEGAYKLKTKLFFKSDTSSDVIYKKESAFMLDPVFAKFEDILLLSKFDESGVFINSSPDSAKILVNGSDTAKLTPAFIKLDKGSYIITLLKDGFLDKTFEVSIIDEKPKDVFIELQLLKEKFEPVLTTNSILLPEIFTGTSVFKNIRLDFDGTLEKNGTVLVSSKWISIHPLSFNKKTVFTVSADSRWLEEGKILEGTITFNADSKKKVLNVKLTTLFSSARLTLSPDKIIAREEENFFIKAIFNTPLKAITDLSFSILYDKNYVEATSITSIGESFELQEENIDNEKGIISVKLRTPSGFTGEKELLLVQFKALKKTQENYKTLIKILDLKAYSSLEEIKVILKDSEVLILEALKPPEKITGFRAEGLIKKIHLSWNAAIQGTYPLKEYQIFRANSPEIDDAIYLGSAPSDKTYYIDEGLFEKKTYYYWVIAIDTIQNNSPVSLMVSAEPIIITESLPSKVSLVFYIGKPYVYINGIRLNMEVSPFIKEGRTFVPVRYIAEPFGAQVLWDSKTKKVSLIHKKFVELWIENSVAKVDGVETPIDKDNPNIFPFIINGRTVLPLRFVSETFEAVVTYIEKEQKIIIEYKN